MNAPTPGSPEWLTYITASKVAAIVGTSPYESRFSLWHRMSGNLPPQEQNDQMTRGNYLEPAILTWFADQHPELGVAGTQEWVTHHVWTWAGATLDGRTANDGCPVEVKSARYAWEWANGAVPPGYVDQCQWQAFITDTPRVYVAALVDMEFVERTVERDDDRIAYLLKEATEFRDSLLEGRAPGLDDSTHTYQAIRTLHPDLDPTEHELDDDDAREFIYARRNYLDAEARWALARSRMTELMGSAQRATHDRKTVAIRKAKNGGTPWVEAARNLPTIGATA